MIEPAVRESRFEASRSSGEVSALLLAPAEPRALFLLAHGAGAGMRHPFMETISLCLARAGIATFRYNFPYMENGRKRPDPGPVLQATVRSAAEAARSAAGGLPLIAGGKSMGGRMTSLAMSERAVPAVRGLVFLGFPLHPAGKPSTTRAEHLSRVSVPMLFLQGTRDRLADQGLLAPVVAGLGRRAAMHVVDGADHSFGVPKRSGRSLEDVVDELAAVMARWLTGLGGPEEPGGQPAQPT